MMNRRDYSQIRCRSRTRTRSSTPRRIEFERDVSTIINIRDSDETESSSDRIIQTLETCYQVFARVQAIFMLISSFWVFSRAESCSGKQYINWWWWRKIATLYINNLLTMNTLLNRMIFFCCVMLIVFVTS